MTNAMNLFGTDTNAARIANALIENGIVSEEYLEDPTELLENLEGEFDSFEGWKRAGFSVKKGEHRLARVLLWTPTDEEVEDEDGNKSRKFKQYWANIYSKDQVMDTETAKAMYKKAKENARHEKEKAETVKAETPKAEKVTETPKAEKVEKAIKQTAKKKVAKTVKKTAKVKAQKTSKKAEKKVAKTISKAETRKVQTQKTEKAEPKKVQPKAEIKHNPVEFARVTKNGKMFLQIKNYNGNVEVGCAEIPFNYFSEKTDETKITFKKMMGIA